ncbi:hypothetical protein CFSAN002367_29741 [Clostridium botulinum CFSAN002367]|nr:hypothetical protein CFSAN002367_29741 [Clostridium botulinum CFSAN002367]
MGVNTLYIVTNNYNFIHIIINLFIKILYNVKFILYNIDIGLYIIYMMRLFNYLKLNIVLKEQLISKITSR